MDFELIVDERERETEIQRCLGDVLNVIDKLENSKDISYIKENITLTDSLSFEINCYRVTEKEFGTYGDIYLYEIYAIKDEREIDCATIEDTRKVKDEIEYLLKCYV